jgi:hypothetical protein
MPAKIVMVVVVLENLSRHLYWLLMLLLLLLVVVVAMSVFLAVRWPRMTLNLLDLSVQ